MRKVLLGVALGGFIAFLGWVVWSFQAPSELADAESAIGDAVTAFNETPNENRAGTIYMLINEARLWLESAEYYHENGTGVMDRGRVVAQTYFALAYAKVAEILAEY